MNGQDITLGSMDAKRAVNMAWALHCQNLRAAGVAIQAIPLYEAIMQADSSEALQEAIDALSHVGDAQDAPVGATPHNEGGGLHLSPSSAKTHQIESLLDLDDDDF